MAPELNEIPCLSEFLQFQNPYFMFKHHPYLFDNSDSLSSSTGVLFLFIFWVLCSLFSPSRMWFVISNREDDSASLIVFLIVLSSSQKVSSLNGRVESAAIPSAKKADLKDKLSVLQVSKMTKRLPYFSHICCLLIFICMKLVVN